MVLAELAQVISFNAGEVVAIISFPLIIMAFVVIIGGYLSWILFRESVFALLITQMLIFMLFIGFLLAVMI